MDLTPARNMANTLPVSAKSLTGVSVLQTEHEGALCCAFFCAYRFMVGVMVALRSAAPRCGNANSVTPATLLVSVNGGGFITITEGTTMSIPSSPDFQDAVESIESLSRYGFSRISAIARLAILAMESPGQSLRTPEDIRYALSAIWGLADDMENSVTSEADRVGCGQREEGGPEYWQPAPKFSVRSEL